MPETTAVSAPCLNPDSTTAAVAAWCVAHKLRASAVGRWVWVPYAQLFHQDRAELAALMARALGWRASKRRSAWFHDCGVAARKRVSGSLERYHRTISARDFVGRSASYSWFAKGRTSANATEETTP